VNSLALQKEGLYHEVINTPDSFLKDGKVINYVHDNIVLKMTKDKGRGLFATEDIDEGDLLIVEKGVC
jgi:hypothetical protein